MSPRALLRLSNDDLSVALVPDKGADIVEIVDCRTGVDVLFRTPWEPDAGAGPVNAAHDSRSRWLAHYAGGWQILCPNAGPEREVDGVVRGFHGEAAIVPWRVVRASPTEVQLQTTLFTAPLHIRRRLTLSGPTLTVHEQITNISDLEREVVWVHHPAFGAPFVAEGTRVLTGARTLIADAEAPGTLLAADSVHSWPQAHTADGRSVDLTHVPGPDSRREIFGCLTEFDRPFFKVINTRLDVAVTLGWDREVFPHAWLWQELCATRDFPWFRRAYVIAVEPASTIPGSGEVAGFARGQPFVLAPHADRTVELRLSVSPAEEAFESESVMGREDQR